MHEYLWETRVSYNTIAPTIPALCFDPFAGSGTTMIVARNLGRRGYGIDLSHEYCQMARDRMSLDFGTPPITATKAQDLTPMEKLLEELKA